MKFEKALKLLRKGKKVRPCECRCWIKLKKMPEGYQLTNARGEFYSSLPEKFILSDKWELVK